MEWRQYTRNNNNMQGFSFGKFGGGGQDSPPPLGEVSGDGKLLPIFGVEGESAILQIYMIKTLIMIYYMLYLL